VAFYAAFRDGDLAVMEQVWGVDEDVVCIHPGRRPLAGRRAVLESWQVIFGGTGGVKVRFDCQRRMRADDLAVHMGLEVIGGQEGEAVVVTATNVYALTESGWRLCSHHAGPVHRNSPPRGVMH
jgi:ketosteroid isomerase-like protein